MKFNKLHTALFSLTLSSVSVHAVITMPDTFGVGLGIGGQRFDNQFIAVNNASGFPSPMNVDLYQVKKQHRSNYVSFLTGYTITNDYALFNKNLIALNYRYFFNKDLDNQNVTLFSLPNFTNYVYSAENSSQLLSLMGKSYITHFSQFYPYLSGGIGLSFNRFSQYSETARPGVTPRTSPGFQSHTNSEFAYTLGAGIDWKLGEEISIGAGYEFQDLGKFTSGNGLNSWSGQSLNYGDLKHHSLLLTLTFTPVRSAT